MSKIKLQFLLFCKRLNERRSTIATKEGQFRLGPDVEELASSMPLGSRINISNEARALMKDPEGLSMSEVQDKAQVHLDELTTKCKAGFKTK
ncbi:hypothetical protein CSKR_201797 [Clonorchis sinensis]|uniref:Uncharacterized protein n=1 Tax=Clonorchis sinensis TaxID=79923 RepID=A0A8T1MY38_CLOSI|nr:hypothetical protein CSKR_201797 [Clonorchis sinensis]